MNIILASNSPRRKEILQKAGYKFEVIPSLYDENIQGLKYSAEIVINCACNKAFEVAKKNRKSLVIGADTVVVHKNRILGKPQNKIEAFEMLKTLSNDTHFVASAICLIHGMEIVKGIELTNVTFRELSDTDIMTYIKTRHPLDKAGSYGVQDEGFDFAINIEGNLDNVIGFPMKLFDELLSECI
ncbi:MAG: septum formation protein Maf [Candidatus Gastranaerophilales bacterium]|nr:septum formation protein Maf [bacterium]MBR2069676.1 septum formation protein Maf [Candidatus Gastranaerophilales bacterium]